MPAVNGNPLMLLGGFGMTLFGNLGITLETNPDT